VTKKCQKMPKMKRKSFIVFRLHALTNQKNNFKNVMRKIIFFLKDLGIFYLLAIYGNRGDKKKCHNF
jgi:hypothetical protein